MGDYAEFLSPTDGQRGRGRFRGRGSSHNGGGGRGGGGGGQEGHRGRGFSRGSAPHHSHARGANTVPITGMIRGGPIKTPFNGRNVVSYGGGDDWTDPFSPSTSHRPSMFEPPPFANRGRGGSFRASGQPRGYGGDFNRRGSGRGGHFKKTPGTSNLMYGEGKFNCKNCYMGFYSEGHFKEHNDYHVKCTEEDCNFEGISKIVAKHIMDKHSEGVSGGMKTGSWSKERDLKWVEQRAAYFPSSANIQQKADEEQARAERGELITHGIGKQRCEKRPLEWADEAPGEETTEKMKKLLEEAETSTNQFEVPRQHALARKSLLENLLEPDIRRERNRLLQCIFYIVDNLFPDENSGVKPSMTERTVPELKSDMIKAD